MSKDLAVSLVKHKLKT